MKDYSGQWIGRNVGPNAGTVILDLDKLDGEVAGHFYLFESAESAAGTFGEIRFRNGTLPQSINVAVYPFDASLGRPVSIEEFKQKFHDYDFPTSTDIMFADSDGAVTALWRSDIGTIGRATLHKGNSRNRSSVAASSRIRSWAEFRNYVSELESEEFVFRGQSSPWPLRTSFHRTSRSDLVPFIQRDVPQLYNQLSGRLRHLYDLSNPTMNASLWALAQHHGYPTPLLDWTYSPFVAAYFAYENVDPKQTNGVVRIFMLSFNGWIEDKTIFHATHSRPIVCLFEPFSLENDRSIPQQSIMMLSNVDDIEDYVSWREKAEGQTFLRAFDLPVSERREALKELRLMGIGAGSLFPGIDGTCRDFKERFFPEF